jgi:hypothetical protein
LNGLDFESDLGCSITGLGGMLGAPARTLGLLDVPGLPGGIDPGIPLRESPRTLTIGGLVRASTFTGIPTILDWVTEVAGTGLVEIAGPFSSGRAYYGVLQTLPADLFEPTALAGWAKFTLTFICPMPYAVTIQPETIAFGSTAVSIPLGTAPSMGRDNWSALIEIVGAATTPTITYSNHRGDTIGTMVFTNSPSAGDSILIDCGRRRVQTRTSGTFANGMANLTAGYAFPALDPSDGYTYGGLSPRIKVSSGSGMLRYYKMWR